MNNPQDILDEYHSGSDQKARRGHQIHQALEDYLKSSEKFSIDWSLVDDWLTYSNQQVKKARDEERLAAERKKWNDRGLIYLEIPENLRNMYMAGHDPYKKDDVDTLGECKVYKKKAPEDPTAALKKLLSTDMEYYETWKANLATAFQQAIPFNKVLSTFPSVQATKSFTETEIIRMSRTAAENFLNTLIK